MTMRQLVTEHIAAFNAHDTSRLVAGLAPEVVWATGKDTVRGRVATAGMFDTWLWSHQPMLTPTSVLTDGDRAAVELVERLVVDGSARSIPKAVFFTASDGLFVTVKVYAEGSAEL